MRIIGGKWRGQNILSPAGCSLTRPTADRTREAIASSILAASNLDLEGKSVLDAFAGSGAMGFELLSRGAAHVTFIDQDRKTTALIRKNAQALGAGRQEVCVVCQNALRLTEYGALPGIPFDIVFLDPPYALKATSVTAFLTSLEAACALAPHALIVYEHNVASSGILWAPAKLVKSKRYGIACVDLMILQDGRDTSLGEKNLTFEGENCGEN